jgi:hypothetical protein
MRNVRFEKLRNDTLVWVLRTRLTHVGMRTTITKVCAAMLESHLARTSATRGLDNDVSNDKDPCGFVG